MAENVNPNYEKEEKKNNEEEFSKKINHSFSFNGNSNNNINRNRNSSKKNNHQNKEHLDKGKNLGTFILGQKLGSGTFGIVRLATHIITGEKVAVKILDRHKILKEADKKRLEREIKILKKLRHNNIVHLYNVIQTSTTIYLVMEYVDGKELFEYIVNKRRLSELEACKFYQQLISGIEYLGKLKITHRDLKPENLLLDKKKNIKIVDFGLSNIYKSNELLSTACGSPCYAAPEMLSGKKYNGLNVDIWSSGIVLYAMICGSLPFEDPNNEILYKKIKQGIFKIPEYLSDSAKDFLHKILNTDPNKRYTIEQIKSHPWFNIINPKLYMSEGLLLNTYIVPIDEDIIDKMANEYEYNSIEVRINLLANKHNHLTTTYYLLLKKKLKKGEKSICNTFSSEFIRYIKNPENLLSNYYGNWKKLFQDRAKDISKKIKENKSENKIINNKKESSKNIKKNNKFEIVENNNKENNNFSIEQHRNNSNKKNNFDLIKKLKINENQRKNKRNVNNENQNQMSINNNNIYNNSNINNNEKLKIEKKDDNPKKLTIFEYLKKIKEIGKKKYYKEGKKEEKNILNYSQEKEKKNEDNIKNQNIIVSQIEKKDKKNKEYKEYENKLTVVKTIKRGNHKYSASTINSNTIDKELFNQKYTNLFSNNLFDINQYMKQKRKKNLINRNIIHNYIFDNLNNNTNTSNYYKKNKMFKKTHKLNNKSYFNQFSTIEHDDSLKQTINLSKIKEKKSNKNKKGLEYSKYVESRYYFPKKVQKQNSKEFLNNSFNNINKCNTSNKNIKNKYKTNNFNDIYKSNSKNKYNNYLHKKNSESSLYKRKKYSQSVNSKLKKNKNKNRSTIIINNNYYINNITNKTIENIDYNKNNQIRNISSLIYNSSSKKNYSKNNYDIKISRNLDNDDSYAVNYIIKKKLFKDGLFNTNNFNRKRFFNTSVSFEKTDDEINDELFLKKTDKIIKNKNKNNYIFINVENYEDPLNRSKYNYHKSSKDMELEYDKRLQSKEKDKNYLKLKSKYKNFNDIQELKYNNNKKPIFYKDNKTNNNINVTESKNDSKKILKNNINKNKKSVRFNKSSSIRNYVYKNQKYLYKKKKKIVQRK